MRVISGKYKGRRLQAPKDLPTRPTTDRAKEGLFNILNNWTGIQELKVLDLFSGIGSISLEFLSRYADSVDSVEQNNNCIKFQLQTKEQFEIENWNIIKADAFKFIAKAYQQYDIIFADPPYEQGLALNLLESDIFKLLAPGGLLVIEHEERLDLSEQANFVETRKYGHVHFSFFELAS